MTTEAAPPTFLLNHELKISSSAGLDNIIKAQFELARERKVLLTDPLASDVRRRRIPGKLGLVAEHEPTLFVKKRPASIPSHVPMDEPFNPEKFNFNSVSGDEVLLHINFGPSDDDRHPILVNVSPLMYGHGLLIPWGKRCLPQRLTPEAVGLAIDLLRRSPGCEFCVGFNSLGAFSSVNHLHLHILYPNELDHEARGAPIFEGRLGFPVMHAPILRTVTESHMGACRVDLLDWMVPCLSFRSSADDTADKGTVVTNAVSAFVTKLHERKIPHNVLFVHDAPVVRVIIVPRQPQHHFDAASAGFNAALGEIGGLLIAKSQQHFDDFEESDIMKVMRRDVACSDSVVQDLCSELIATDRAPTRQDVGER